MVPGRKDEAKAQWRRGRWRERQDAWYVYVQQVRLSSEAMAEQRDEEKKRKSQIGLFVFAMVLHTTRNETDQKADSNFGYRCIDSVCLNRPAAPKVLPWQQDGNGDHNVFMVPTTWGLRSGLSGDHTLPRARRVWAKSLHTRQQRNTEEP